VPSGFSAYSASVPSPGIKISNTELKYTWRTSGLFQNNNFVLSGTVPSITIWRKYYYAGNNRVAMQVSGDPIASQNGVFYLLSDHLGSNNVTIKAGDEGLTRVAELRYKPWGENRYSGYSETAPPTDRRFTGQRLEQELGIYHYGARGYVQLVVVKPGRTLYNEFDHPINNFSPGKCAPGNN
jgi:hypothetical protein